MPETVPLRVYLDANVLFSAAHDPRSTFLDFWKLQQVAVVTSAYAVGEVSRNLTDPGRRTRFEQLLAQTEFINDANIRLIPPHINLVAKDAPILAAAIAASVDYLVTGDKNHFGHLYQTTISGVRISGPSEFLSLHRDRLIP